MIGRWADRCRFRSLCCSKCFINWNTTALDKMKGSRKVCITEARHNQNYVISGVGWYGIDCWSDVRKTPDLIDRFTCSRIYGITTFFAVYQSGRLKEAKNHRILGLYPGIVSSLERIWGGVSWVKSDTIKSTLDLKNVEILWASFKSSSLYVGRHLTSGALSDITRANNSFRLLVGSVFQNKCALCFKARSLTLKILCFEH